MKILYHSVSPFNKNAHGRCTSELVYRLLKEHEVDIYAWFGLQQTELMYPLKTSKSKEERLVRIVGNPDASSDMDHWNAYLNTRASEYDLVIDHTDLWLNWRRLQQLEDSRWVWWVIGDSSPVPAPHRMVFQSNVFLKGIPMTNWFWDELKKCPQIPNNRIGSVIHHGVDLNVFYPSSSPQIEFVPESCEFFIISVADNKGHRENLPEMIEAYSIFLKETNANAYFYIHAFPYNPNGYNLHNVCAACEELYNVQLNGKIGFKEEQILPDSFMRDLYSRADTQLMCVQGGSFELPLIEAGACGCPSISTNFSAPPELLGYGNRGLLVPTAAPIWGSLTSSRQFVVNPNEVAQALITYYENTKLRKKHAQKMQNWVKKHVTWNIIGKQWLKFIDEEVIA